MALVGFSTFIAVKQFYQYYVLVPSVHSALRDELMGKGKPQLTSPRIFLPWLALPLVFILGRNCAAVFYRAGRQKRQITRDLRAALLLDRLQQGAAEPFSLYLRSFAQEERLKRRKGLWWYLLLEGDFFGLDRETLDLLVSSEAPYRYPTIALGRPGEKLGAGRLPSTDADWEALVLLLMRQAQVIFIVPGTSEGVMWEMERLKDYRAKTVYLMPPTKYYHGDARSAARHWHELRHTFMRRDIFLPGYDPKGALFTLDERGRVARQSQFAARFGGTRVHEFVSQMGGGPKPRQSRALIPVVITLSVLLVAGAFVLQYKINQLMNPAGQNAAYEIVRYDKDGVSFTYHSNWDITDDYIAEGRARRISIDMAGPGAFIMLVVPPEIPLDVNKLATDMAKERPAATPIVSISESQTLEVRRTVRGQDLQGIRHKYSGSLLGVSVPYTQDFFQLNAGRANAMITFLAPDEDWQRVDEGVQLIFDSLRFE
jgi:hypothetical protein